VHTEKRGFTLIELLVVIAIIAILAAILFPVFLSAKARALQTQCLANLKQIGYSTSMYLNDNGGRYVPWLAYNAQSGEWEGCWYYLVQKYSKTKLMANCPAVKGKVSYYSNAYTNYWYPQQTEVPPPTDTQIRYSKTTVYLLDGPPVDKETYGCVNGQHNWWGPPRTEDTIMAWSPAYAKIVLAAETRHNGAANVVFCDWHAGSVKPGDYQTNRKGTSLSCPLRKLKLDAKSHFVPDAPWGERNDGVHPWFRGD